MRIVYIGSFTRIYDEEGIARSFEELGHKVFRYEESGYNHRTYLDILRDKPDFVLFAKLKIPMALRVPFYETMKSKGILTVCWIPDLYIGLGREAFIRPKVSIFQADHVFSPDGGHDKEWKEYGVNHHLLRQGIYAPECITVEGGEKQYDVAFVGTVNGEFQYRQELVRKLFIKYGTRFGWFGKYSDVHIRGSELSKLISSTPVMIGDSVYSPRYWSNRIYETIGRGGFIIHPNIPGLEEEFTYYKHFIPYDYGDWDGLFEKISYYLTHENERKHIAKMGQEYVKGNHTLAHRCKTLLTFVS